MKRLLLILLCLPMIGFGQLTYVPDNNFEAYLEINGMGNGIPYDSSVFTSAIDTLTYLDLSMGAGTATGFFDLTGIEDFTALTYLNCSYNQLTSLNVSNNTALTGLWCNENQIASLDVSNNHFLKELDCGGNQLTTLDVSQSTDLTLLDCGGDQISTLDVSQNTDLTYLECAGNQLTSLDVSNNTALTYLHCEYNQLTILDVSNNIVLSIFNCDGNQLTTLDLSQNMFLVDVGCYQNQLISLDVRNGNNINFVLFRANQNQNLTCIDVDDSTWSTNNWTVANGNIDPQHFFSSNCIGTGIEEFVKDKPANKITNLLGKTTKLKKNSPLFYIYDDKIIEKKIIIE